MSIDLVFRIALTLVPNVGAVHARTLIEKLGNPEGIFNAKKSTLEKIGEVRAHNIKSFKNFKRAEQEILFIQKFSIHPLFITDSSYPQRFLNCYDPPTLLYYKGNADVNASRVIAIVGTRSNTEYGKQVTETLVNELNIPGLLIVSGLAYGIDAIAHKAALKNDIPTIGVVGHGLDTIYPWQHKSLAKEMIENGGILTEFISKTKPDKHNFPIRNRIVAGISDATVLIETGIKGGSLITAEMANGYNRDVFAYPGRTTDTKSAGCNWLIKNNKAILLSDANQLIETLGWNDIRRKPVKAQKELFTDMSEEEKKLVEIIKDKDGVAIDEINLKLNLSSSTIAAAMLNLELQGLIISLPGKRYKLA
jgi:DNA processing protein